MGQKSKKKSKSGKARSRARALDEVGSLKQSVDESPIANTKITGLMTTRDARLLVIGAVMRTHAVKLFRIRQRRALIQIQKISKSKTKRELVQRLIIASTDDDKCANEEDAAACRSMFKDIRIFIWGQLKDKEKKSSKHEGTTDKRSDDISRIGIALTNINFIPSNPSWQSLEKYGMISSSFGQCPTEVKVRLARRVEEIVNETWGNEEKLSPEVLDFIGFIRNNPGAVYKADIQLHRKMLCAVQMSSGVTLVSRSLISQATAHRFLPIRWLRSVPLLLGSANGDLVELRTAATLEETRIRPNAFSYDNQHGLGLCGSTHRGREELDLRACRPEKTSFRKHHDQLSELIINDPKAKLGNWFCNDLDKVLNEFVILNAQPVYNNNFSQMIDLLPGETPIIVGQNPRVASSIGNTQHTQIASGYSKWWPVLQLRPPDYDDTCKPIELPLGPDAFVELVQIGDDQDSVSLRVETVEVGAATDPVIVKLMHGARVALLNKFGGRGCDFNFYACMNNDLSGAVILLTPMAMIQANSDRSLWFNDDTGKSDKSYRLPCHSIDFSQGKGNIHVFDEKGWKQALQGRSMMTRLYDFVHKPGCRKVLVEYLKSAIPGWKEPHIGLAKEIHNISTRDAKIFKDVFWNDTEN